MSPADTLECRMLQGPLQDHSVCGAPYKTNMQGRAQWIWLSNFKIPEQIQS